mmetsp:Transcript_43041/g.106197  ORF Transcript_43041/g.106197 Transcript_43041/m.106197 type:complete len:449 (+) Transcript_43041:117-1463(+)
MALLRVVFGLWLVAVRSAAVGGPGLFGPRLLLLGLGRGVERADLLLREAGAVLGEGLVRLGRGLGLPHDRLRVEARLLLHLPLSLTLTLLLARELPLVLVVHLLGRRLGQLGVHGREPGCGLLRLGLELLLILGLLAQEPGALGPLVDLERVLQEVRGLVRLHLGDAQLLVLLLALVGEAQLLLQTQHLGRPLLHRRVGHQSRLDGVRCVLNDRFQHRLVRPAHERHGAPTAAGAGRAADAVHIGAQRGGHLEVDHRLHALDVEPAAGQVGGHEVGRVARAEAVELLNPLQLRQLAVQLDHLELARAHERGQAVRLRARAGEDEHPAGERARAEREQRRLACNACHRAARLLIGRGGGGEDGVHAHKLLHQVGAHAHLLVRLDDGGAVERSGDQLLHGGRDGRGKEQRLPATRRHLQNLVKLGAEAQLEQTVRLVEYQHLHRLECDGG